MGSPMERLNALRIKTFDSREFIPDQQLRNVLTEPVVLDILSTPQYAKEFYKRRELTLLILQGGLKVFGILILMGKEDAIWRFIETDHFQALDSRLPLSKQQLNSIFQDPAEAEIFYSTQWTFLAPLLRCDRSNRVFEHDEMVLPFISVTNLGRGGFGTISKVNLSPSHQQVTLPDLGGNVVVIRKEIMPRTSRSNGSTDSENEEERILYSLRELHHPHLVEFLASYRYRGILSLLFSVAESDLEDLLHGEYPRQPHFVDDHTMLLQIHGIGSALQAIHTFFISKYNLQMIGAHHDLKPKNILLRGSKLLLTDFGVSRLDIPGSDTAEDTFIRTQGYYYAPECQTSRGNFISSSVGRECDVWSFGCIFAMILTFLTDGATGVKEFEESRKTRVSVSEGYFITRSFHSQGEITPAVMIWLTSMESKAKTSYQWKSIQAIRGMLQIDPSLRPNMGAVMEQLFQIARQAQFEISCEKFESLLQQTYLFDTHKQRLRLEFNRYRIWEETTTVTLESSMLVSLALRETSLAVINTLTDIDDELRLLGSWNKRSIKPTYVRLKSLIDKLWTYLPPSLISEKQRALSDMLEHGWTQMETHNSIDSILNHSAPLEYMTAENPMAYKPTKRRIQLENATIPTEIQSKPLLLQANCIECQSEFGLHALGSKVHDDTVPNSEPVMIEWVKYDANWDDKLMERIAVTAGLFNTPTNAERPGLRVLQCKGYFKDDPHQRFGLVYRIPSLNPRPVTLRQLIKDTSTARSSRPMLGELFQLTQKIARCVLEVHRLGRVHRNISSYNIIFFPTLTAGTDFIQHPYLIGFSHSRRDNNQTSTQGTGPELNQRAYQHPEYLAHGHGFRPEHDYYSVGLVLLEIGRWRTISQITKRMSRLSLRERSDALLKECMENLGNAMGVYYRDAVEACLKGGAFGDDGNRDTTRNLFDLKVVSLLMECKA